MSQLDAPKAPPSSLSRRRVLSTAAWSVPVVAVATSAPAFAASEPAALGGVEWTESSTSLASLALLDGGGTVTAQVLVTLPIEFNVDNTGGQPLDSATVSITVGRPGGINLPVGRARGFGVASVGGTATTAGERTATYQSAPIVGQYGFPITTWTGTRPLNVAPNGNVDVPVEFGLAGTSTGVTISALSTFPVTLSITYGGVTQTASTTISVPVGAGIL